MVFNNLRTWRWSAIALIILLFAPALILRPAARTEKQSTVPYPAALFHDDDESGKKGLSREELAEEALVWHKANLQRLERTHPLGVQALTTDIINQDMNDIAVLQGDDRLITPQNDFDLSGRAVTFTPSGSGYTISTNSAAFDTDLGDKLNLTVAPAVNPKEGTDAGDDAYIVKDLGISFSLFGTSFPSVAISSNGNLTFRPANVSQADFDADTVRANESLSGLQSGLPRIAPYWHDLDARANQTTGAIGIYFRQASDRVLITWNNIRDFPNDPITDNGVHRFQVSLFNDGRIVFTYSSAQLTSTALAGISPGKTNAIPMLVNLNNPPSSAITTPIAEFFSTSLMIDTIGTAQAFYATHPGRDVYDFIYLITDFSFNLGNAFAFYLPLRNDAGGIGQPIGQSGTTLEITSQRIQGILNLSNLQTYPESPITRFLGANHALSIMGQEQGHRWLAYTRFPGNDTLLLGRDNAHWSFFLNIESTLSSPAARRSSSAEGNVFRDNGNGTFTSVNLIDGYSRLDQYLIGLRPASEVPDTFVIANPTGTSRTRGSNPSPNVNVTGTKQNVSIGEIVQANGNRTPNSDAAQKNFRAAVVLLTRQGTQPSAALLNKIAVYRLGWESYFSQSTDYLGTINTGLADQTTSRVIAATSAASFKATLTPGEIGALFGAAITNGGTEIAISLPLPTKLAGTEVRVNGVSAPLFFASPTQINFQIPRGTTATTSAPAVSSSTALIEVVVDGQLIRAGAFQIAPTVPGIFTLNQGGTGAAAAVDAITGALAPFNATQTNGQPNIIAVFGSGLGSDATDVDGNVNASVQATIDGNPVTVNYAGRAPGFIGLNQFNIVFPGDITSGTHRLVVSRNGIPSQEVTIAVK